MCGRDEFCKLRRKRKAWVLGHSDRDREVYVSQRGGGAGHQECYQPWVRGSDIKYKWKPLEHLNLHSDFNKMTQENG